MGNVPSVPGIYGPLGVCVVASLSPRWGLFSSHFLPTACAVGCILTPLRGSTELAGPLLGRRSSYDTDSYRTRSHLPLLPRHFRAGLSHVAPTGLTSADLVPHP